MTSGGVSHPEPGEVSQLLVAWRTGDVEAPGRLFALVYDELRVLARVQARRGRDPSLGATALVHEAYLKLADHSRLEVVDRSHFFALAARAMRQVLVDRARRRMANKRGGAAPADVVGDDVGAAQGKTDELLALNEALTHLETLDPRLARLVEVRFFAGMSVEESAVALDVSVRTIKRDWHKARALLHHDLAGVDTRE